MLRYPVKLTPDDNGTILVTFPDFPEAHTFGDDKVEALARAADALETVIDAYIRDRRLIPAPSSQARESVALPALVDAKVQIYNAMREQHVGKTELAKRLNVHLPQVDRLLDVRHGSKVDQLEAAADALGGTLEIVLHFAEAHADKTHRKAVNMMEALQQQLRGKKTSANAERRTATMSQKPRRASR